LTRIELSRRADADLAEILEYSIAAHGPETAEAYLRGLDAVLTRLSHYPELGAPRSDLGNGIRSIPAGEHRIYYRYDRKAVLVVRVLHKAMDAERHL
jgi:toxin ParE1/3/4